MADLDLVEVAPNERPPVCRIMDFGKFKYQQKKRQHKGHAHQTKIKEIRVRPKTGDHDIEVKVNKAREFLSHKDKVIVTVVFRGRELAHVEEGRKVIDDVLEQLADVSKIEAPPVHHGRRMICTLAPESAPDRSGGRKNTAGDATYRRGRRATRDESGRRKGRIRCRLCILHSAIFNFHSAFSLCVLRVLGGEFPSGVVNFE